mmetsp:Transcript_31154/g.69263  ORF Transcript_31154/g.69263 Transcript_31154/m.69263 type:complete len:210 (-) Transcript_31154:528-1157(-)
MFPPALMLLIMSLSRLSPCAVPSLAAIAAAVAVSTPSADATSSPLLKLLNSLTAPNVLRGTVPSTVEEGTDPVPCSKPWVLIATSDAMGAAAFMPAVVRSVASPTAPSGPVAPKLVVAPRPLTSVGAEVVVASSAAAAVVESVFHSPVGSADLTRFRWRGGSSGAGSVQKDSALKTPFFETLGRTMSSVRTRSGCPRMRATSCLHSLVY